MGHYKILPLLVVLLLSLIFSPTAVNGAYRRKQSEVARKRHAQKEGEGAGRGLFILGKRRRVVKTEGGEVRVVSGRRWRGDSNPMHIGFISMQPNTLFIPQYIDANLILFVQSGEAKMGWMNNSELVVDNLKAGDVNVILAGSPFYIVNTGENEKLQIISSMDTSENAGYGTCESFFIGGGNYPTSVLSGFDNHTIRAALNITEEQFEAITGSQSSGPIIYLNDAQVDQSRMATRRKQTGNDKDDEHVAHVVDVWSWGLFDYYLNKTIREAAKKQSPSRSSQVYNIYDKRPSYENNYGWSTAVNEHDYSALQQTDISLYLVNLTAGSMLAPHVNPSAIEYGIVLSGSGTIQVVFPNGTTAMNARVHEGDVFWIPRYFPFCQVASSESPLEFFGFTTSSSRNRPQFLAGASSVLRSMRGPELAAAFGISEEQLEQLTDAQQEGVILPPQERLQANQEMEKAKKSKKSAEMWLKRGSFP